MSGSDENYEKRLESERARALVWFGILAIIATVREAVHETDLWNFPCNSPCIHLSLYVAPVLTNWIYLWLGYGGCMLAYFSEDWFQRFGQQGRAFREIMRRIGNRVFLYFYPLTVGWFTATSEGSFLLPAWIQGYYWVAVALPLGSLTIWTIEGVIGRKITGKKGAVTEAFEIAAKLAGEGFEAASEWIAHIGKRLVAQIRHTDVGPVSPGSGKLAIRSLVLAVVIGETALAWWVARPPLLTLAEVPIATLYVVSFVLIFVGLLSRKDLDNIDDNRTGSNVGMPSALQSSFKVFIAYGGSKAREIGLEMADCLSKNGLWPRIAATGSPWSVGVKRQELIFREELTCQAILAVNAEGSFNKEKFWDEVDLAKYETRPPIPVIAFLRNDGGHVILLLRTGCRKIQFDPGQHRKKCVEVADAIKEEVSQANSANVVGETDELPAEDISSRSPT